MSTPMTTPPEAPADLYAVLSLARSADATEIQRAYLRCVRRYSAEFHLMELQRVRLAHDVLRATATRAQYDALEEAFAPEVTAFVSTAVTALLAGQWFKAQVNLDEARAAEPSSPLVALLLGLASMHNDGAQAALTVLRSVEVNYPDHPSLPLRVGQIARSTASPEAALPHLQRAVALSPLDPIAQLSLAECHAALGQLDAALVPLAAVEHELGRDDGAPPDKVPAEPPIGLRVTVPLRRLSYLLRAGRKSAQIDADLKSLRDATVQTPAHRPRITRKLAETAMALLEAERSASAQELLDQLAELGLWSPPPRYTFPSRITRPLAELSEATRERLEQIPNDPPLYFERLDPFRGTVLILFVAAALLIFPWWILAGWQTEFGPVALRWLAVTLMIGPVLGVFAGQRLLRTSRSRAGRYYVIDPLYMLRVTLDEVTAWPLVLLDSVTVTDHYVYTRYGRRYAGTSVTAKFARHKARILFRSRAGAEMWERGLQHLKLRSRNLLRVGLLEDEPGFDLVPLPILKGARVEQPIITRPTLRRIGIALAFGAVNVAAALVVHDRQIETHAWNRATGYRVEYPAVRDYLARFPTGRHAAEAREQLDSLYAPLLRRFQNPAISAPVRTALVDVFTTLQSAPSADVPIEIDPAPGTSLPGSESEAHTRTLAVEEVLVAALARSAPQAAFHLVDRSAVLGYRSSVQKTATVRFSAAYTVDRRPMSGMAELPPGQQVPQALVVTLTVRIETPATRKSGAPHILTFTGEALAPEPGEAAAAAVAAPAELGNGRSRTKVALPRPLDRRRAAARSHDDADDDADDEGEDKPVYDFRRAFFEAVDNLGFRITRELGR